MKFSEFEHILSHKRLRRYLEAVDGDSRKAMTLYRYNLRLSQVMFTVISCFEVALRNAIDRQVVAVRGEEWLKDSVREGGFFDDDRIEETRRIIKSAYRRLRRDGTYSHSKMIAEMEFGVWKYMFSSVQFRATGRCLLNVFPNKPRSSAEMQYNHSYFFNELDAINRLRNRIAHHEPVCFHLDESRIDTAYIINAYNKIQTLFAWMGIDSRDLLYGLDNVQRVCNQINALA